MPVDSPADQADAFILIDAGEGLFGELPAEPLAIMNDRDRFDSLPSRLNCCRPAGFGATCDEQVGFKFPVLRLHG